MMYFVVIIMICLSFCEIICLQIELGRFPVLQEREREREREREDSKNVQQFAMCICILKLLCLGNHSKSDKS